MRVFIERPFRGGGHRGEEATAARFALRSSGSTHGSRSTTPGSDGLNIFCTSVAGLRVHVEPRTGHRSEASSWKSATAKVTRRSCGRTAAGVW
jgi:hypothetical protein